jgi:ribonuclease HII
MHKKSKKRPFLKKNHYENIAWEQQQVICGIDEVGRGSLAGPVVAAAVILPINCSYRLLKDSKIMSVEDRKRAYSWIIRNCAYGVGIVHHRIIDERNIWQSTLLAMHRAVMQLFATTNLRPSSIVVDAMPLKLKSMVHQEIAIHHFPFGETKSTSIAAASILAKVTRDQIMLSMDKAFPHFVWYSNKGYSTQQHWQALKLHNKTIIHRTTYLENQYTGPEYGDESNEQQRIC